MWKWLLGNKQMIAQNRTTLVTFTSFVFLQLRVIKSPCVFLFEEGMLLVPLPNRSFYRRFSHSGLILIAVRFIFPPEGPQAGFSPAWQAAEGPSPPRKTETPTSTLFFC